MVSAEGEGHTPLSAFDTALFNAGVQDFNLLYLSSVIPPGSRVKEVGRVEMLDATYGDKLYVVHADIRSNKTGKFIGAGVGWYQYGEDKRGVFVEHSVEGGTFELAEQKLLNCLQVSMRDLCKIRGLNFKIEDFLCKISVAKVGSLPTCVLALAVYQCSSWKEQLSNF